MNPDELELRAKRFAIRVITLVDALPGTIAGTALGRQLVRSGTSVSANYRAARRARSRKEFIAKIGIVTEEADETTHWLELVVEAGLLPAQRVAALRDEAAELMRIFSSTRRTAISNDRRMDKSPNRQITKSPNPC